MIGLDLNLIEKCKVSSPWDLGNRMLYDLCCNHFGHDTIEKVVGKVWLIGRTYAVAVERRKNGAGQNELNDAFYLDKVAPTIMSSELDERLKALKVIATPNLDNLRQILETHRYLTAILRTITDMDKRSFSSKYLHFHLPKLFFIYDTRAVTALRKLKSRVGNEFVPLLSGNVDGEYANFYAKCYILTEEINERYKEQLSPRQLDNLLLEIAHKSIKPGIGHVTATQEKVAFFKPLIESGNYTQSELVEKGVKRFPTLSKSTIQTFLVDSKNAKYNKFEKLVVSNAGKLTFKP